MADESPGAAAPTAAAPDPKASATPTSPASSANSRTPSPEASSDPAANTGAKPFNVDELVRQNLRETNALKRREAEIETKRKEVEAGKAELDSARPVLELLSKVDRDRVVKALGSLAAGDRRAAVLALADLTPEDVLGLADSIEAAQAAKPQRPVADIVKEEVAAVKKAEEEAAKAAEDKKRAEEEAGFAEELNAYVADLGAKLRTVPDLRDKFPLCVKMAKWLPLDDIRAEATRIVNAGGKPFYADVLAVFEKQFADAGITVTAPAPAAPPANESFTQRFARRADDFFKPGEASAAPPASVPIPQRPASGAGTAPSERALDRIYRELDEMGASQTRALY